MPSIIGLTPIKSIPIVTATNETKGVVNTFITEEFKDTLFEVAYDSFVEAYLGPSTLLADKSSAPAEFSEVAARCLSALEATAKREQDPQPVTHPNLRHRHSKPRSRSTSRSSAEAPPLAAGGSSQMENPPVYYEDHAFYPLRTEIRDAEPLRDRQQKEKRLYAPLVNLMSFIQRFFRTNGLSGDGRWQQPVDPIPKPIVEPKKAVGSISPPIIKPKEAVELPLERVFIDTHGKQFHFYHENVADSALFPDLALVLDDGVTTQRGYRAMWRDVRVGIEVKFDTIFDSGTVAQVARYARAMRMDQPERNFFYTLLISKDECRIFRWDSAACYVTEPLAYHEDPERFIELIGRLAALSPEDLGFDLAFSNSGRVHSSKMMETTLTISPSQVRNLRERGPDGRIPRRSHTESSQGNDHQLEVFLLANILARVAQDYNFCRSTTVWVCQRIVDGTPQETPCIIKQNYQDDSRPHEASFYTEANGIEGVGHLECFQQLDSTREYRERIDDADVTGCWRKADVEVKLKVSTAPTPTLKDWAAMATRRIPLKAPVQVKRKTAGTRSTQASGPTRTSQASIHLGPTKTAHCMGSWKHHPDEKAPKLERVLLRLVFDQVGAPLNLTEDATQLISVAHDCLNGIWRLWLQGIIHRDISFGNLLVTISEPYRGFLIDLGLSMRIPKDGQAEEGSEPHHHLTGTLPFIAVALLRPRNRNARPAHEVGHDIESLFWVLLWICLTYSDDPNPDPWVTAALKGLNHADTSVVASTKVAILASPTDIIILGKYSHATLFLREYAELCRMTQPIYGPVNDLFNKFKAGDESLLWTEPPASELPFRSPGSPSPVSGSKRSRHGEVVRSVKRSRNTASASSSRHQ
ncbi:hypothetical protein FRB94_005214 [Tulasnella sp. JGI-2019a]|nr:hypothetical protein FRB93_013780 [Tulasnella sp. JGI-2019a]KAG9000707.1 hypothetical protein FRB94_005214 [Tulasnella sp. JGI-2019a]